MKLSRVMIAAPKSGSGKTTLTCALLQILKEEGRKVVSYKCGPDYIDPLFHQKILGIPSKNLDTFFTGEEKTLELFLKNRTEEEFAVIEGVMGLFDGLGGSRPEGSSYQLARETRTPIILVVDAGGMGQSVIPLIAGFLSYDAEHLIKGVILNRMSKAYYETIGPMIEKELHIQVVGYFPKGERFAVESRYLGLRLPDETQKIKEQLRAAAEQFKESVKLCKIEEIAGSAPDLAESESMQAKTKGDYGKRPVIAVARDEAFCFYYEDNLELLREYGAETAFFSPLRDQSLPEGCSGLLLGGGYPELYAETLSKNIKMKEAIREAAKSGMPLVAECGGFMYLHRQLKDKEGKTYKMAGVFPVDCCDRGKSVRFGYIELEEKKSCFLPEKERIRGHEFHYFDSEENGQDCIAIKPVTGKSYSCIHASESCFAGFPHLYYPSNPGFAENFVRKCKKYSERKKGSC